MGCVRLVGLTVCNLLGYPVAAFAVGAVVTPVWQPVVSSPWLRTAPGVVGGLVLIYSGGLAQLAILTGDISAAARFGTWPFLLGDLLKLAVLVPVLTKLTPTIRARL